MGANKSLKPTPLRYGNGGTRKRATVASTAQRGLALVLGLMGKFFAVLLGTFIVALAGCTSLAHGPDRPPTRDELLGVYDWGHAGSAETWELHADGSFTRTLHAHLGSASATFSGTWSLQEKRLLLSEAPRPHGTGKETVAEAFFYKRMPAFARVEDIQSEKVHEWWVYKRRGPG